MKISCLIFYVWGIWDFCTYPDKFTVSYSGGKMRREKAGQVLHENCARELKDFLLIFSFVTERICYQLDMLIILSI